MQENWKGSTRELEKVWRVFTPSTQSRTRCLGNLRKTTRTVVFWAGNLWCEVTGRFLEGMSHDQSLGRDGIKVSPILRNVVYYYVTNYPQTWVLRNKQTKQKQFITHGFYESRIWEWLFRVVLVHGLFDIGIEVFPGVESFKGVTNAGSSPPEVTHSSSCGQEAQAFPQPPLHLTGELTPREKDQWTRGRGKRHAFQVSTFYVVKNWAKSRLERWFGS